MPQGVERVLLRLQESPEVVNVGVGVHGVHGLRDVFRLPDLWQFHLYGYSAELTVNGSTYCHFRPSAVGEPLSVPVVQEAGTAAPVLSDLLRQAIEASPSGTARVAAEVWTALWRVSELGTALPDGGGAAMHPAVSAAIAYIEANLARPLTVPDLARAGGVSHNHLTRLFRAETGTTVVAYIRLRRMARARHLLVSSTLSIPAVAASVGISDLQAFNKACRRELGGPPRTVRAGNVAAGNARSAPSASR
jgi:AraC family transcriptional regulator